MISSKTAVLLVKVGLDLRVNKPMYPSDVVVMRVHIFYSKNTSKTMYPHQFVPQVMRK